MDLNSIKAYYEDNLRKGYTIEQISANLRNSGYTEDLMNAAISQLTPEIKNLSQENSNKFDYSKLPKNIQNKINPAQQSQAQENTKLGNPQPSSSIDKHPGLDTNSKIKYISIISGVLLVVIVAVIVFAFNDDHGLSGGRGMDRYVDAVGVGDDTNNLDYNRTGMDETESQVETPDNETWISEEKNETDVVGLEPEVNETIQQEPEPIVQECEKDSDCFDGNLLTINFCENNVCRIRISDDGRECISGDGFCPERCYGYQYNDTDCVDAQSKMLCTTNDHCYNFNNMTEDFCQRGVCVHLDIKLPNNPPVITSEPDYLEVYSFDEYTYQVIAEDEDGDDLIFSLSSNAPENMTINNLTGLLKWFPTDDDYSSGNFSIIVSDGKSEARQYILIMVFIDEEDDPIRKNCGTGDTCYYQMILDQEDYKMCKYLEKYWESPVRTTYECLFESAQQTSKNQPCNYIYNTKLRDCCRTNYDNLNFSFSQCS